MIFNSLRKKHTNIFYILKDRKLNLGADRRLVQSHLEDEWLRWPPTPLDPESNIPPDEL